MKVGAEGYFAIVPEWILDTASSNAVKLYGILRRYADKTDHVATPARRALATRMGFSRPQSVDPAIAELVALGALEVTARHSQRGDQDSNEYLLISLPPANVVRRQIAPGLDMWVVDADPSAVERTGEETPDNETGDAVARTAPSAFERTGGDAAERTTGSAAQRTTVVRESAHKPESPNQRTSPADAGEEPRKRGTRLAEPFIVNRDMRLWAAEEVPGVDVDASTRMFVDHWRAASGRNATKRDWLATWRNWLRRDHQMLRGRAGSGRESSLDRRDRQIRDTFAALAAEETSDLEIRA